MVAREEQLRGQEIMELPMAAAAAAADEVIFLAQT
jgi:hypothetical protein